MDCEFNPPSRADRRFKRDFAELLARFRQAKLKILPSLISFEFGSYVGFGLNKNGTGFCGRADVIRDRTKRTVFLQTVLADLLEASKGYEDVIYAWEVINEPIWLCLAVGPLSKPQWSPRFPEVSITEMRDFLTDAVAMIHSMSKIPSTVGHRYFDDIRLLPAGEKAPQFHYYADHRWYAFLGNANTDPDGIRGQRLFTGSPKPFVGEFDSAYNRFGHPWAKDLGAADSTTKRLELLAAEGCDLALLWADLGGIKDDGRPIPPTLAAEKSALGTDDVLKLLPDTRKAIVGYTGGVLPPAGE
jgi:hypothetical protein